MLLLKQAFSWCVVWAVFSSVFRVNSLKNRIVLGMKSPLYITVGPQCAGKTTILQQLEQEIVDITLDDQRDVYVKVPTRYFLSFENGDSFLQTCVQRKSLASRIQDNNVELKAVLCRLSGRSTRNDFEKAIRTLYQDVEVAQLVITTVEEHVLREVELPESIDLFCVESLFRPHADTRKTGIESAHAQLHHVAHSSPQQHVAWGNTNTRPREYKEALAIAFSSNRPVHFVLYGDSTEELHLPKIGLPILFQRNLSRLLQTGKYIPAQAMFHAHERSLSLVQQAMRVAGNKLELDQELARMANFHMHPDRTVRPIPQEQGRPNYHQRSYYGQEQRRRGGNGYSQEQRRGYENGEQGQQYRPQGSGRRWENGGRVRNGQQQQQQGRPHSDQGRNGRQYSSHNQRSQQVQPYNDQDRQHRSQDQQRPPKSNGQRRERHYPQDEYFPPPKRQGNRDSY